MLIVGERIKAKKESSSDRQFSLALVGHHELNALQIPAGRPRIRCTTLHLEQSSSFSIVTA